MSFADVTPRLLMPLLASGQAQKEVVHNEALQRLDMLVQATVASADLSTPPAQPVAGTCWIVAADATGAWAGRDGAIAQWTGGGWRFCNPRDGWQCYVADRNGHMTYGPGGWHDGPVASTGVYVDGVRVVGPRGEAINDPTGGQTVDMEARSCLVHVLAVLRAHGLIAD